MVGVETPLQRVLRRHAKSHVPDSYATFARDMYSTEGLAKTRLRLHRDKTQVSPSTGRLKFLGFALEQDSTRLQQSAIKRFNRRRRFLQYEFAMGRVEPTRIRKWLEAWSAHVRRSN